MREYPNLELIEYMFIQRLKAIYPEVFVNFYPRVWMDVFNQTWGSTALGFGGCGGSAMTDAYTTVVRVHFSPKSSTETNVIHKLPDFYGVYFDGRFAYQVYDDEVSDLFFQDLTARHMVDVQSAASRYAIHGQ